MKRLFFAAIGMIALLTSCSKSSDTTQSYLTGRVKTYTEAVTYTGGSYSTTYNLSYDGAGRLVTMVDATAPGDKFVYSYGPTSYTMEIFNSGILDIHEDFFLNNAGFPDSTFQYNSTLDSMTERMIYNGNNQLTTYKEYDYSKVTGASLFNTTTYTYNSDGTLLKTVDTDGESYIYDYYANLVYQYPMINPGDFISNPVTGAKNLIHTQTFKQGGVTIDAADYTYTFDANNRISTAKATSTNGTVTKTYTYY